MYFLSAVVWFFIALAVWHLGLEGLGASLNLMETPELAEGESPPFLTAEKLWVYLYIVLASVIFGIGWVLFDPHPWRYWSVLGSVAILLFAYFSVQIGVWLNSWYGEFYDLIQKALGEPGSVALSEFYGLMLTFLA